MKFICNAMTRRQSISHTGVERSSPKSIIDKQIQLYVCVCVCVVYKFYLHHLCRALNLQSGA